MTAARGTSHNKRAEAKSLAQTGMSCRAIALELGVSRTTVSRWAKEDGYTFDRSKTDAATTARQFDMHAARIRLAEKMTANADKVLDSLDNPFLVYSFGGKDNTYREHTLDEAPMSARREAQTISAIAFDKLTKALEGQEEAGVTAGKAMLVAFGKALGVIAED